MVRAIITTLACFAALTLSSSADIFFKQVGSSECPEGAKLSYPADFEVYDTDGSAGPRLIGWYYMRCDGWEEFVSNQSRTRRKEESGDKGGTPLLSQRILSTLRSVSPAALRLARSRGVMAEIRILSDQEYERTQEKPAQTPPQLNVR